MRISVRVKPGAKQDKVEKDLFGGFTVWVKERPIEGRANEAVRLALAEYFGVSRSAVSLVKGHTAKIKIFEVSI